MFALASTSTDGFQTGFPIVKSFSLQYNGKGQSILILISVLQSLVINKLKFWDYLSRDGAEHRETLW